jgi:hypothetical protein
MNVTQIVEKHLRDIGADGLCATGMECGCLLKDYAPGDCIGVWCVPAMNRPDQKPDDKPEMIRRSGEVFWMVPMESDNSHP